MSLHRIFVDATGIVKAPTGLGKYSYHLLKALLGDKSNEFQFSVLCQASLPKDHNLFSLRSDKAVFLSSRTPVIGPMRDIFIGATFSGEINRHCIYHNLSSYLPAFGLKIPSIVTMHDLKYLVLPGLFKNTLKAAYYRWIVIRSVRKAKRIVAVSTATKNSIIELGIRPEKISVVPEAITVTDESKTMKMHVLIAGNEPYFFFIGDGRPHKNLERVIMSYRRLVDKLCNLCPNLVIAGIYDKSKYNDIICSSTYNKKIVFLGVISDDFLVCLYKNALALVYPSLYEGFGLPILEAMGMGTPIITSNCSSMPEVAGKAALLVDPYNIDQIYDAMLKIATSKTLREKLKQSGLRRVQDFSWEKIAHQILLIYRELLR